MSEFNTLEKLIIPEKPRTIADEQIFVYAPKVAYNRLGLSGYNPEEFIVNREGIVSLRYKYADSIVGFDYDQEKSEVILHYGDGTSRKIVLSVYTKEYYSRKSLMSIFTFTEDDFSEEFDGNYYLLFSNVQTGFKSPDFLIQLEYYETTEFSNYLGSTEASLPGYVTLSDGVYKSIAGEVLIVATAKYSGRLILAAGDTFPANFHISSQEYDEKKLYLDKLDNTEHFGEGDYVLFADNIIGVVNCVKDDVYTIYEIVSSNLSGRSIFRYAGKVEHSEKEEEIYHYHLTDENNYFPTLPKNTHIQYGDTIIFEYNGIDYLKTIIKDIDNISSTGVVHLRSLGKRFTGLTGPQGVSVKDVEVVPYSVTVDGSNMYNIEVTLHDPSKVEDEDKVINAGTFTAPKGTDGKSFEIKVHVDNVTDLPEPAAELIGNAYSVGKERPYDVYVLEFVDNELQWLNHGPIEGPDGLIALTVSTQISSHETSTIAISKFNRVPVLGDIFIAMFISEDNKVCIGNFKIIRVNTTIAEYKRLDYKVIQGEDGTSKLEYIGNDINVSQGPHNGMATLSLTDFNRTPALNETFIAKFYRVYNSSSGTGLYQIATVNEATVLVFLIDILNASITMMDLRS